MPWVRLDDGMAEHRKTRRLLRNGGVGAFGLHALALIHCGKYLTDGHVDEEFVDDMCEFGKVRAKDRDRIVGALVACGQWSIDHERGGWLIHDYLEHNPSRAKVEADRAKDAERKARGRQAQSHTGDPGPDPESDRCPPGHVADSERIPVGVQPSRPYPSLPGLTNNPPTPQGGSVVKFDRKVVPAEVLSTATAILDDFNRQASTGYGAFTGSGQPSEALKRILGALRDHPTLDQAKASRIVTIALGRPFWEGKPQPGVVFGPGVVAKHLEDVSVAPSLSVVDRVARLNAAGEAA